MRVSKQERNTQETQISIDLNIDEARDSNIVTESPFFTHMLEQLAKHGLFGLNVEARGDVEIDDHHLVEDAGIVLGKAFAEALGDRKQIRRYGSARVPMDETLVAVDIDLCTRPYLVYELDPQREFIGGFDTSLAKEFWQAFVNNCGLNLHIELIRGGNAHHILEASFKAFALAMRNACELDPRKDPDSLPSTKGLM